MKSLRNMATFSLLGVVLMTFVALPANAVEQNNPDLQKATTPALRDIGFDHAADMSEAIAATVNYHDVVGFTFDNPGVYGQYFLDSGVGTSEYLRDFQAKYGTQPRVVSAVVDVQRPGKTHSKAAGAAKLETIPVGGETFEPVIGTGKSMTALKAASTNQRMALTGSQYQAARDKWKPETVSVRVERPSGSTRVYFEQFAIWPGPSSPQQTPYHVGVEMEVNLYNSASSTSIRPLCAAGYKDAFFAKNYSWNWSVYNSDYSSMANVAAYADYNDLSDECNRNSIAIGMRYPKNIPTSPNNPGYAIGMSIDAPKGTQSTNRIAGVWQLVTDDYCSNTSNSGLTDCMGLNPPQLPTGMDGSRATLSYTRNYVAPDRCWNSSDYGWAAPASIPTPSGC